MSTFFILIFYFLYIIFHPEVITKEVINTSNLFLKVMIPSIIPNYLISSFLLNNNFFTKITTKFKHLFFMFESINSIKLFIISCLIGNPVNIKHIIDYYNNNLISKSDCEILLKISNFMNPLFIVSICILNNINPIVFLIINYLSIFLILLNNNKKTYNFFENNKKIPSITIINNISNTLLSIYSFLLFINLLKIPLYNTILSPITFIFEITSGVIQINNMNINIIFKYYLLLFMFMQTGICIILQSINEIKKGSQRSFYKSFFIGRLYQIIIATTLFIIFFF